MTFLDAVDAFLAPWRGLTKNQLQDQITALQENDTNQEIRMSLTDSALSELDAATNEVAGELDDLEQQVAAAVASGQALDSSVAARISAAATRLRGLAADPEQPVPPADGGDTAPVDEPAAPADGGDVTTPVDDEGNPTL